MKHLNLELERLEQRIAPGGLTGLPTLPGVPIGGGDCPDEGTAGTAAGTATHATQATHVSQPKTGTKC